MFLKTKQTFFKKLFLSLVFISIFSIFTTYIINMFFLDKFYIFRKERRLTEIGEVIKANYKDKDFINEYTRYLQEKEGIFYKIIFENNNKTKKITFLSKEAIKFSTKVDTFVELIKNDKTVKLIIYSDILEDGQKFQLVTSISAMDIYKKDMYLFNLLVAIISIFICLIISKMFASKFSNNLKKVNSFAKSISNLQFQEKIDIKSGDEIEELSQSISKMSQNLEEVINSLKNFVSNASHEMKTPLSVIKNYSQALIYGKITDEDKIKSYQKTILDTTNDMINLINNLLIISKLSNLDLNLNKDKIILKNLIEKSIDKFEDMSLSKDIEWDIKIKDEFIYGDEEILKIAFDNIVNNALKYSEISSKIFVSRLKDEIYIANKLEKYMEVNETLLEPFSRGSNSNSIEGNGLGLSIIDRIFKLNNIKYRINIEGEKENYYFCFYVKV